MLLRILHNWSSILVTCRITLALNQQGEFNRAWTEEEEQMVKDAINKDEPSTLLLSGNDFKDYKKNKNNEQKRLI